MTSFSFPSCQISDRLSTTSADLTLHVGFFQPICISALLAFIPHRACQRIDTLLALLPVGQLLDAALPGLAAPAPIEQPKPVEKPVAERADGDAAGAVEPAAEEVQPGRAEEQPWRGVAGASRVWGWPAVRRQLVQLFVLTATYGILG